MRPRIWNFILCSLVATAAVTFEHRARAEVPSIINVAVPPPGSSGYIIATGISKVLTDKTPIKKVTLQTFGGAAGWPVRMQSGEVNFGAHCGFKQLEEAHYGQGAFEKFGKQKNVLNMVSGHGLPFAMSILDPKIKRFEDLKGKTIFLMSTHRDHLTAMQTVMKVAGLTMGQDVKTISVRSPREAISGMLTGRGDGFFAGVIPGLAEVQRARGLYAVPMSERMLDEVIASEPVFGRTVIPVDASPLRPKDPVPTLKTLCGIAAGARTSEEAVYLFVKTTFEHFNEWSSVHPLAKQWSIKGAASVMNAPYHPGAIRYYREKGVWSVEQDAKQKELSAR
ncbi:MAG: TAXI family TRAP transporter solute-binding subunit [Beijerinckiaceae bacterium]